jgi:hypothetical protein
VARALQGHGYAALVAQAVPGALSRLDLTVAREIPLQQLHIFVIYVVHLFGAKPADFLRIKIRHLLS